MTNADMTTRLPMLRKELFERAARRRTYVVRWVYAICFLGAFLIVYHSLMSRPGVDALGQGDETFLSALWIQVVGIVIFLPPMMCGLITDEKERGTFQLLMLTDISGGEAIMQKFLGGLIPMVTLLLLTLPVGGFAYLLGGLTMGMVVLGSLSLVLFAGTIAAISLACSSYARTTLGALVGAYLIIGLGYLIGPQALYNFSISSLNGYFESFCYAHVVLTAIALLLACQWYHTRANVAPSYRLRRLFQRLDKYFVKVNERYGGIELVKDSGRLPDNAPILWRERQRRQLGQLRYQVRYLVIVEILAIGVALLSFQDSFRGITLLAWVIGSIILVAQASNLIVTERLSQSLEILLATPLSGADIVSQKARSLIPLMLVIAAPILTLTGMQVVSSYLIGDSRSLKVHVMFHEVLHLFIFLPLFLVIGLAVGLGARSRVSAMMRAIGVLVVWCAFPMGLLWLGLGFGARVDSHFVYLKPSGVISAHYGRTAFTSFHLYHLKYYVLAILAYSGLAVSLFWWCLRRADQKLGRP